jgi:hypothetical protein
MKHPFIGDHKEKDTYSVYCDFSRIDHIIPNFLGGAIPRSDRGNREYYCMSILTIFKLWRWPQDPKDKISTWDKTFLVHKFSDR